MKFRIVETPAKDIINEGKTMLLNETALFLNINPEELYSRSFLADSMKIKGYMLEISERNIKDD